MAAGRVARGGGRGNKPEQLKVCGGDSQRHISQAVFIVQYEQNKHWHHNYVEPQDVEASTSDPDAVTSNSEVAIFLVVPNLVWAGFLVTS